MEKITAIHYLAQMLNAQHAKNAGYSMPTRWLTLRDDLKEKYIREAKRLVDDFESEEIEMKRRREQYDHLIKYY